MSHDVHAPTTAPGGRRHDARQWLADEGGNALVMMPAAVLIALGLIGFAVDSTIAWRSTLEAESVAASLANDAASAVSTGDFYDAGDPEPAPGLVADLVNTYQQASASTTLDIACTGDLDTTAGAPAVVVTCAYTIDYAIHLFRDGESWRRSVSARAELQQG